MLRLNHLNSPQFREGKRICPTLQTAKGLDKTSDGNDGQKEKRLNMAEEYFEEIKQTTVLNQATDKTEGMSA